ncbi:Histidinol-phosphate transaminase [Clostridium carboxidivorans P7]|uniref:histidinol-phosphate transaminase n=1 Tax=Clostridium carboxidivorans P7 TaxID=536227 RepID=C6PUQ5_9CLOT|nr:Histidinol-phosphate transaminase [Clostridium carboxidivorans P7]EFG89733.1 histidinol-phosphate aminotransferase family protein [Clostridium carboxidivorans P7]
MVIQTLSKSRSLAGIRVGFAMGNKELIQGLNRVKNSFNSYTIDRVAAAAAVAAIKDKEYFTQCVTKVINTRERIIKKLNSLGFNVVPSKANFIFITHKDYAASDLFAKLREKSVLVRYFSKERINNYLRVSIGSDEEMNFFIEKLQEIMDEI